MTSYISPTFFCGIAQYVICLGAAYVYTQKYALLYYMGQFEKKGMQILLSDYKGKHYS